MNDPFMARAIELSIENVQSGRGGPFGAVIVRSGQIVAEGANQVTSLNDPTAHAEILAIRQACAKLGVFELKDCELYTSCEPCPMCLGAIYWARLLRLYFANTAEDAPTSGSTIHSSTPNFHCPIQNAASPPSRSCATRRSPGSAPGPTRPTRFVISIIGLVGRARSNRISRRQAGSGGTVA